MDPCRAWGRTWAFWMWTTFLACSGALSKESPQIKGGEFCMFDKFEAKCDRNEVVQMEGAYYGRMKLGACVSADLGYVGCYSDVLDIADNRCSGKRHCTIAVPDEEIASRKLRQACLTELTMYLEANYSCRKVIGVEQRPYSNCDYVKVTQPSGTIASVTTRESGCGSPQCPWLIEAPPGQRINITLINYGWSRSRANTGSRDCQVYATAKDVATSKAENICARNQRVSHVYTSLSHSVEVRIVGVDRDQGQSNPQNREFLFEYQFIGCVDLAPPAGGWMMRAGDVITMGCNATKTSWKLKCEGGSWKGEEQACPGFGPEPSIQIGSVSLPSVLSVLIIVAVAFVVGALILCIGVILFRRRYVRQQMEQDAMYTGGKVECPPPPVAKDSLYMPPMYNQESRGDPNKMYHTQTPSKQQTDRENYTPIWERPLPVPSADTSASCTCPTGSAYGSTPLAQKSSSDYESEYNTLGSSEPSIAHAQTRRMVYGNNTIARKECEKISPDSDIDPRYFQLDPDTMSGEI